MGPITVNAIKLNSKAKLLCSEIRLTAKEMSVARIYCEPDLIMHIDPEGFVRIPIELSSIACQDFEKHEKQEEEPRRRFLPLS
jgi:hypothetical protein